MLDDAFELHPSGVGAVSHVSQPRIDPAQITSDWHNAYASFVIDLSHQMQNAASDRQRRELMAELRGKLGTTGGSSAPPARPIPPAGAMREEMGE